MEKQIKNEMFFIPLSKHDQYKQKIRPLLEKISEGITKTNELISYLKQFKYLTFVQSYGRKFDSDIDKFQYRELQKSNLDVKSIFQNIAKFVLKQQNHFETKKINILLRGQTQEISLQKDQVFYLLCLMALNLVPLQQYQIAKKYQERRFPFDRDFQFIFSYQTYKTRTILQYFKFHFQNPEWKQQQFKIKRLCVNQKIQSILNQNNHQKMRPYTIESDNESIQNFTGQGKVDFANKFIGGGVFHKGCVQQQIMFANHPQLLISVIFCEQMNQRQSILLQGFRKYSKNTGYARTTKYDGQQKTDGPFFTNEQYIIAIDALRFQNKFDLIQTEKHKINRQILKAYAGFINLPESVNVVTGNWGCGAFSGDIRIKFLIQWIACSLAGKQMIYCPFGSKQLLENNKQILQSLKSLTVPKVHQLLIYGARSMNKMSQNIFRHIKYLKDQNQNKCG